MTNLSHRALCLAAALLLLPATLLPPDTISARERGISTGRRGEVPAALSRLSPGARGRSRATTPLKMRPANEGLSMAGLPRRGTRIKIWINSFIPYELLDTSLQLPLVGAVGSCFSGDKRSFSDAPDVSCRTHQVIEFDTGTLDRIDQSAAAGETHKIDCQTKKVTATGRAKTRKIVNGPVSLGQWGVIKVNMSLAANNPLVFGAPDIDLWAELFFDLKTPDVFIQGAHDGFPAFEIYTSINGGRPLRVYDYMPQDDRAYQLSSLYPPLDVKIKKRVNLAATGFEIPSPQRRENAAAPVERGAGVLRKF